MLKKLSLSLFLGLLYLFISISLLNYGNTIIQSILFLFAPLPILLALLSFSFWVAFLSFIPILSLLFINFNYAVVINIILTLPLFLIFLFIHIKRNNIGKYIHLIVIAYATLIFLLVSFYFNSQNFTLPDFILDTVHMIVLHLNSLKYDLIKEYDLKTLIRIFAFLLPTLLVLIFYLILLINYVTANWIINNNNNKPNSDKFKIALSLPSGYIYIYVCFLIVTLIINYTIKNDWNISYIMYNIALFLFIPFLISGLGVVNYIISKNKFFLLLLIILIFISNLYVIVILCLLGFLKEAKIILHNNVKL